MLDKNLNAKKPAEFKSNCTNTLTETIAHNMITITWYTKCWSRKSFFILGQNLRIYLNVNRNGSYFSIIDQNKRTRTRKVPMYVVESLNWK